MESSTKSSKALLPKEQRLGYRQASLMTRQTTKAELAELDHLASEGLETITGGQRHANQKLPRTPIPKRRPAH